MEAKFSQITQSKTAPRRPSRCQVSKEQALGQNIHTVSGNPRRCPPRWHGLCPQLLLSLPCSACPSISWARGAAQLPAANTEPPPLTWGSRNITDRGGSQHRLRGDPPLIFSHPSPSLALQGLWALGSTGQDSCPHHERTLHILGQGLERAKAARRGGSRSPSLPVSVTVLPILKEEAGGRTSAHTQGRGRGSPHRVLK